MLKGRRKEKVEPATLTFRGLDLCDGCGSRLETWDRLCGLCPVCLSANGADPIAAQRPTRKR